MPDDMTPLVHRLEPGNRHHELSSLVSLLRARGEWQRRFTASALATAVEEMGSAVRLLQLSPQERLRMAPAVPAELLAEASDGEIVLAALYDVDEWMALYPDIRSVLDSNYPANLRSVFDRPSLLFFHGTWDEAWAWRSVSIVGARTASDAGRKRAFQLAGDMVDAGYAIFSGLALGIDSAAHRGALAARGRTVAVMGTGIKLRYPRENAGLADEIVARRGCLVSQFFPEHPPTRNTFPMRNAVMSGLTLATVVIEARHTSGAKMQARFALQHGRTVFIPEDLVRSHDWARDYVEVGRYNSRAITFRSVEDILQVMAPAMGTEKAAAF